MDSVVVLVGRPNVGKSTLFNRLTGSRDALVADQPGLTRDRLYGVARMRKRRFIVVDTGGIDEDQDTLKGLMSAQTQRAIDEADAIVFLVDGRDGLTAPDRNIGEQLRRSARPVIVAVNKTEGMAPETASAEFHALGLGTPVAISAAHGQGMERLLDRMVAELPQAEAAAPDETREETVPRVAVVGRPNVGKSTLVNAMLGENRVLVFDAPGTTRDSIRIPLERDGNRYVLIDTAGVRRRTRIDDTLEKFSVIKTLQAVEDANVVVLVVDARREIGAQDAGLAGFVLETGKAVVLAVNKWDGLAPDQRDRIRREISRKLPFITVFAEPHFISALHGSGLGDLFGAVDRAFQAATCTLSTPRLNRVLKEATQATPPPMGRGGRRIKIKFAHQGGRNPPLVLVHGNQVQYVPEAYRRYLANTFRRAFKLEGTPLRVEFRQGRNPYENTLARPSRRGRGGRTAR